MIRYSQEEKDFILDNWKNVTAKQLAIMFTNLFGREISEGAVHQFLMRKGLKKDPYTYASDYTYEMCDWIKENYRKYPNVEAFTNAFNNIFNVQVSQSALWHKAYRLLGCSQVRKAKDKVIQNKWTLEMVEWLKNNIDNYSYSNLAKKLNELYGSNLSASGVEHKANRSGFKKTTVIISEGSKQTWFNGNQISWNKKPLGYERVDKKHDLVWIKVAQPDVFMAKQRLIYQLHYGEIPPGVNIVFKNGNKRDFRIENLVALNNSDLALFNTLKINPGGYDEIANIKVDLLKLKKIIKEKCSNDKG